MLGISCWHHNLNRSICKNRTKNWYTSNMENSGGKHLKRCAEEPDGNWVGLKALIECAECGEFICQGCYPKHHAEHENEDSDESTDDIREDSGSGLPYAARAGARVTHPLTHLQGVIMKVKDGGPLIRLIVEWDDDTASIHNLEELFPIPKN